MTRSYSEIILVKMTMKTIEKAYKLSAIQMSL